MVVGKNGQATLKMRLWLEQDGKQAVGIGITLLLMRIDTYGSLKQAAEHLNMSYRTAWGRIKKAEERAGQPLVQKTKGKGQRYELAPYGREIMERFLTFYQEVEAYAQQRAEELLDLKVELVDEFFGPEQDLIK